MFRQYRKKQVAEMRPYVMGESMDGINVSGIDLMKGSPKKGDMIARSPTDHKDLWLVSAQFLADNYEPVEEQLTLDFESKE